jgi:tetratricopeptide (TPR) repeat protein
VSGNRVDFFVSHAGADGAWAEWVAWQLIDAGYSVELDVWDWAAGRNFVTAMSEALARADRVVALFSAAYFEPERYTTEEWSASLVHLPGVAAGRLVPVRVEEVPADLVPPVLRPLVSRDMFGVAEEEARRVLLAAVAGPARPSGAPGFPGRAGRLGRLGGAGPRLPGVLPPVWGNVPPRNPGFTGRDQMLADVRGALLGGGRAVVQALAGMGGVGKTQLAAEYAYRFASGYDVVWWIAAEQAALIGEQVAALGEELGCAGPDTDLGGTQRAVLGELRRRDRWLLVFDNAESPEDLAPWLPGGAGHVLITSRVRGWAEIAVPVGVDMLARAESVAILRDRVPGLADGEADLVAAALGDLPLAVAQAAGYLAETGMPAGEYAGLVGPRAAQLLGEGRPSSYPRPLAAATVLALDRLAAQNPAAAEVVRICAFLAPEPVPAQWFTGAAAQLPAGLADEAADPVAWRQILGQVSRSALARADPGGLLMHRLTQAIIRGCLPPGQATATRARAEAIVAASSPGGTDAPDTWPAWARLLPHLLALDPAATGNLGLRRLACRAARYLILRGDFRGGHDLASDLYRQWGERLGPDDPQTLIAGFNLGFALRQMGRSGEARQVHEDTLARSRRVFGEDHLDTLHSATGLAIGLRSLGETQAARELDEDTLARYRRVQGEDHPHTLASANNLAVDLRAMGETQAARDLDEDTLARRHRVLGEDHPDTLASASNLAVGLRALGETQAARDLDEDTLARRRRVLGEDHPSTLASASNLAVDLRALGETQAARDLDEDTLARRRRVLGEGHPDTLASASNLAVDLRALDETEDRPG